MHILENLGWAIAIDSIWDNTSTNFMFKDIDDISLHTHPHSENIIENVLLGESNTYNKRISESKKTKNKKRTTPSRRMINCLVNNVRLSYATLDTFFKTRSRAHNQSECNINRRENVLRSEGIP